jgi:DnaA family protein
MTGQTVLPINNDNDISLTGFVGSKNALLVSELLSLINASRSKSVIFIWGEKGSGKTHLLEACCNLALDKSRKAIYLNLQSAHNDIDSLRITLDSLRSDTLLCVDNLDAVSSSHDALESLFVAYEKIIPNGGSMVVSASVPLNKLELRLKDLESRLSLGGIYQIFPLNDEDKRVALQQRAKSRGFALDDAVVDFILAHHSRDTGALFSLLDKLDNASLRSQRKVTIPFIKSLD